jgi:hypothetical protein
MAEGAATVAAHLDAMSGQHHHPVVICAEIRQILRIDKVAGGGTNPGHRHSMCRRAASKTAPRRPAE